MSSRENSRRRQRSEEREENAVSEKQAGEEEPQQHKKKEEAVSEAAAAQDDEDDYSDFEDIEENQLVPSFSFDDFNSGERQRHQAGEDEDDRRRRVVADEQQRHHQEREEEQQKLLTSEQLQQLSAIASGAASAVERQQEASKRALMAQKVSALETRIIIVRGVDFLATDAHLREIVATILGEERIDTKPILQLKRRSVTLDFEGFTNEKEGAEDVTRSKAATTKKSNGTVTLPTEDVEVHFLKTRDAKQVLEALNGGFINGRKVTVGYM